MPTHEAVGLAKRVHGPSVYGLLDEPGHPVNRFVGECHVLWIEVDKLFSDHTPRNRSEAREVAGTNRTESELAVRR